MENGKQWILAIGAAGAAALGFYAWFRNKTPEVQGIRRFKSTRKSYEEGGRRQYSLPAPGSTDLAASYREVMIIAHRGASGRFPEHTQKAYHEAVRAGADVVELDTCMTKDGDSFFLTHTVKLARRRKLSLHESIPTNAYPRLWQGILWCVMTYCWMATATSIRSLDQTGRRQRS